WAVRALLEIGDGDRRRRSHPKIRRRAVHAAPHRGRRQSHSGRLDQTLRARARDPGLKETEMATVVQAERVKVTVKDLKGKVDPTYILMNHQVYELTTDQLSPTSIKGMNTKSTPFGSVENPINPIPLAIAAGATYVARGFTGQQKQLVELIKGGTQHRGFALIDTFSPCVTYNHDNTHE